MIYKGRMKRSPAGKHSWLYLNRNDRVYADWNQEGLRKGQLRVTKQDSVYIVRLSDLIFEDFS